MTTSSHATRRIMLRNTDDSFDMGFSAKFNFSPTLSCCSGQFSNFGTIVLSAGLKVCSASQRFVGSPKAMSVLLFNGQSLNFQRRIVFSFRG